MAFHANGNQKKAEGVILIWDKIDFKIKYVTRDQKGHYIRVKGASIHKANASNY